MKVLMTCDAVGGVWTYCMELGGALRRRGVTVELASMGPRPSPAQRREAQQRGLRLHESGFKLEWMDDPWEEVDAAGRWLLALAERIEPDVVHLNGYAHGALPFGAPTLVVAHSCVLSWWQAVKGEPAPLEDWGTYRRRVAAGLRAADLVVAPTRWMMGQCDLWYGPLRRKRTVPNGRDARLFEPLEKQPIVLCAGRLWDEAKNVAALAEAGAQSRWPIHVAGQSTPGDGEFERQGVRWLGKLDPPVLARRMGRAGIYALPARYEPFGLSVLEAALAGCALVLGEIPTLRELWRGAAVFVDPDDPAAVAQAINRLADDPIERELMAHKASERAAALTPQRMAGTYLEIYTGLRQRRSGGQRSVA